MSQVGVRVYLIQTRDARKSVAEIRG